MFHLYMTQHAYTHTLYKYLRILITKPLLEFTLHFIAARMVQKTQPHFEHAFRNPLRYTHVMRAPLFTLSIPV